MAPKKAAPKGATKAAAVEAPKGYDYSGLESGMRILVEYQDRWYSCTVTTVSKAKAKAKAPVQVSYVGHDGFDEWVSGDRIRSKALKTVAAGAPKAAAKAKAAPAEKASAKAKAAPATATQLFDYSGLETGMRLQVEFEGTWYAAEVLSVSKAKAKAKAPVKVSYAGHTGLEEWVGGDRLRSKAMVASGAAKEAPAKAAAPEPKAKSAGAAGKKDGAPAASYDYSDLEQGMRLQVESAGTWYAGEVVTVSKAKAKAKAPVKVAYVGYAGLDEWVGGDRLRSKALKALAPDAGKPAKAEKPAKAAAYDYSALEKGTTLQVLSEGVWYVGQVVSVSTAKAKAKAPVKVTYTGHAGFEEWVDGDRLRSKALKAGAAEAKPEAAKAKAKAKPEAAKAKPKPKTKPEAKAKPEVKKSKVTEAKVPKAPAVLNYFPLWAKGSAPALALSHGGLEWKGVFVSDAATPDTMFDCWKEKKPQTPWGELPVLEVPGAGTIGHELAILNYLARRSKKLGGLTMKDYTISLQLVSEAEDVYQALVKVQPTILKKDKPKEATDAFWSATDATSHNHSQGLAVYLTHLERFYTDCGMGEGKFTWSGVSIGECKLFATLHTLKLIKDSVLEGYPGLVSFYSTFAALEPTKAVVESGGKMPGPFGQYFIAG